VLCLTCSPHNSVGANCVIFLCVLSIPLMCVIFVTSLFLYYVCSLLFLLLCYFCTMCVLRQLSIGKRAFRWGVCVIDFTLSIFLLLCVNNFSVVRCSEIPKFGSAEDRTFRSSVLPNFGPQKILCVVAFCSLYIKAGEFQYRVSLLLELAWVN